MGLFSFFRSCVSARRRLQADLPADQLIDRQDGRPAPFTLHLVRHLTKRRAAVSPTGCPFRRARTSHARVHAAATFSPPSLPEPAPDRVHAQKRKGEISNRAWKQKHLMVVPLNTESRGRGKEEWPHAVPRTARDVCMTLVLERRKEHL